MATAISTLLVILFVTPAILSFHPAERARIRTRRFMPLVNSGTSALYKHTQLAQDHASKVSSTVTEAHKGVQEQAYGAAGQHMDTAKGTLKQTDTVSSPATSTVQTAQDTATPHLDYVQGTASDAVKKPGDAVNDAGGTTSTAYKNTQGYVNTAQEDVGANPVQGAYKTVGSQADAAPGLAPVPPVLPTGPYPKLGRKRSPGRPPRHMIPYGPNHGRRRVYRMVPLAMHMMKIR